MINKFFKTVFLIACVSTVSIAVNKRSDGYFGLHFDFHALKENDRIGETVNEQMVQRVIDTLKPDYIQVDSKGHPGYSSYPTKVGQQTDGYIKDQLKIWRKVTKAAHIPLTVHYSALYDRAAISKHPEWGYMKYDGSRDNKYISMFSPVVQELIIPQLKELRTDYDIDAVWIDGDCWGVQVDYCPQARELFKSKYGDVKIPKGPEDKLYFEYLEMLRQKYRETLESYLKELHSFDSNLEIASNCAYSSYMPEECILDVNWLSSDLTPYNSVNWARFESRCFRQYGKRWDLMSWSFFDEKELASMNIKTSLQLMQEAAIVISQGGGYQVYCTQLPDGSVRRWQIDNLVAKFCRERQPYCQNAKPVLQTAILLSTGATYRMGAKYKRVFGPWGNKETGGMTAIHGISQALCESQIPFDIMIEQQILKHIDELELIIIPEWSWIDDNFKRQLISFVNKGGSLLVIGAQSTKLFENELGISFISQIQNGNRWLRFNNSYASYTKNDFVSIQSSDEVKTIGVISPFEITGCMSRSGFLASNENTPAATINKLGKGMIAGIYLNFGRNYIFAGNCNSRDFLKRVVDELLPEPMVKVEGSHYVDVVANEVGRRLSINLVNTGGPHGDNTIHVFDEIPSIGPLRVSIKTRYKPKSIVMQPDNVKLKFTQQNAYSIVTIPKLKLHQILVVESNDRLNKDKKLF